MSAGTCYGITLELLIICQDLAADMLHIVCAVPKQRHAYLHQAVQLIKSCMDKSDGSTDGLKACSGEIMILCAEVACQVRVSFIAVHVFNFSHWSDFEQLLIRYFDYLKKCV